MEDFVVALVLGFAGMVIEVVEVEPASEFALAEGAEAEMGIEELAELEKGESVAYAVDAVEVDDGVGTDGEERLINLDETLFLFEPQIFDILHAYEEGGEQGRTGDGEADAGVVGGIVVHQGSHESDIAQGGETYDQNVFQLEMGYFL